MLHFLYPGFKTSASPAVTAGTTHLPDNILEPLRQDRALIPLGKRLGIQDVRPHRFRCSFAVDALLKGASVKQIAEWLGDKPETVSAHYLPMSEAMSEQTRKHPGRKDAGIEAMTAAHPDQAAGEPVFARKIRSIA